MKELIERASQMANDQGLAEFDVIYSANKNFSMKAEKGDLSEYKKANSHVLGIRVIKDEHVGISYTEAIDEESIKKTIQSAMKNASFGKKTSHEKISCRNQQITDNNPAINIEHTPSPEEMIERTLYLENEVLKRDKRATNAPYNGVFETSSQSILANSKNTICTYQSKAYQCYTSALLTAGEKNAMHFHADIKRDFRELNFEKCIDESIQMASNLMDASQIKTGKYDVLFSTELLSDLLGSFSLMLRAKAVIDKTNPWMNKLGENVASKKLSFIDDPFFTDGFNAKPFDSEGYKKQRNILIKDETLQQFIHNSATASELGQENNFCAARSAKSSLSTGLSNFIIDTGSDNEEDLNNTEHIEICKAQGLHSGVRPISGDFSLGVSGRVWKNGEITKYFKDVTINGNFYEMLKEVSFVGSKLNHSDDKTFFAPKIIFPGLSIAGN